MHLFIACAAALVLAVFLDRSRVRENGLLFVFKDYVRRAFNKVTLRRVIYTIGILLFVLAAWRALGFDWAFIAIGGDTLLYLEIVSTVYLVAARGYIQSIAGIAVRAIIEKRQKILQYRRSRSRDRRSLRHNSSTGGESDDDAGPAMVDAFAFS
jgi:hypothetical protein